MVKKLIFTALALASFAGGNAVTLTPEEALARAGKSGAPATRGGLMTGSPELSFTKMTENGDPAVYVFNNDNGGYLVLSANDLAYPVLGYSDSGRITDEDIAMNPSLEWWLSEYARQIEYAVSKGAAREEGQFYMPSTRADYEAIAPQIKTKWDQGAPYYNQCPMYGVYRTFTGCVATAMAQVMNYWKYPEVGQGQIGYEASSIGKRLTMNFANKKFDWDNMLPAYYGSYTKEQADAVAYLMKACGYAVKMDYGADSSGALAMNIATGMKKYFNYDPNIFYTLREYYSSTQWTEMIYDNLKNVGPLLYGGGSLLGGGHSFVCDGYDGNGMFHFNWGWSGMSDGYYSLDALNPDALGTGGGTGGGYNFTQDAVLGIQPPTGKPEEERKLFMTQTGSLGAGINPEEEGVLHFELWGEQEAMWVNYNGTTLKLYFGAIFEPQGDTPGETVKRSVCDVKFSIQPGYGTAPAYFDPKVDLREAGLKDGTYKVTMATFSSEENDPEWIPVKAFYTFRNYVLLKKSGDNYEVIVDDLPSLGVEDAQIVGAFYNGCPIKVRAKIVNNFDIELTSGFAPVFAYEDAICFLGESVLVTVPPQSVMIKEWTTVLNALQGAPDVSGDLPLKFTFLDEMTYNLYTDDFLKDVTMKANPGFPTLEYGNEPPVIARLEKVKENVDGNLLDVYTMSEKDDRVIDINVDLTLKRGYFNYPVYGLLLSQTVDEEGNDRMMVENFSGSIVSLLMGRTVPFSTSLNLASCVPDVLYSVAIGFSYGSELVAVQGPWAYLRIVPDKTGVDTVSADGQEISISYDSASKTVRAISESGIISIDLYDLQGRKLASVSDSDTISLDGLKGLVMVHALDKAGHTSTIKLTL